VSEQMPQRITEEEARVLDELADLRGNYPEAYAAVLEDLGGSVDADAGADPEKAHADLLLEAIGSKREQQGPVIDLMNQAWASEAEKNQ